MLSDRERDALDGIERQLSEEDPEFVMTFRVQLLRAPTFRVPSFRAPGPKQPLDERRRVCLAGLVLAIVFCVFALMEGSLDAAVFFAAVAALTALLLPAHHRVNPDDS